MAQSAIVGTRAAYVSCAACGHARIRHQAGASCAAMRVIRTTVTGEPDKTVATLHRCTCDHFTAPKGH